MQTFVATSSCSFAETKPYNRFSYRNNIDFRILRLYRLKTYGLFGKKLKTVESRKSKNNSGRSRKITSRQQFNRCAERAKTFQIQTSRHLANCHSNKMLEFFRHVSYNRSCGSSDDPLYLQLPIQSEVLRYSMDTRIKTKVGKYLLSICRRSYANDDAQTKRLIISSPIPRPQESFQYFLSLSRQF